MPQRKARIEMSRRTWVEPDELMREITNGSRPIVIGIMPKWRFMLGHIPGSFHVSRYSLGNSSPSNLLDQHAFSVWAQRLGICNDSQVIVWDTCYDATWLWWIFGHYGKAVRILEGGLRAWKAAGFDLEFGPARRRLCDKYGDFKACVTDQFPIMSLPGVLRSQADLATQLWDARDVAEWQGRKRLHGARQPGRIPWSRHLPWQIFRKDGCQINRFRSDLEVKKIIEAHGIKRGAKQIFYCQSGVRTATAIYALYRVGWDPRDLYNYCGSWKEWSRQPGLPISRVRMLKPGLFGAVELRLRRVVSVLAAGISKKS